MKEIKRSKKILLFIVLASILFGQACRKESLNQASISPINGTQQLIKQEAILKWIETNPAAQLLTLDWSKARQTVIDGKNVVRIPTLNIDKTAMLTKNSAALMLNSVSSSEKLIGSSGSKIAEAQVTTGNNANYYNEHPPEVFFIEDDKNNGLHPFLLNFVPNDKNKEFGKNNIWTGKLYEWNLTGDTLLVQEIDKSKIVKRYGQKIKINSSLMEDSSLGKSSMATSSNDNKISGAWADFWKNVGETIAEIWGDIGHFFGVATYDRYSGRYLWDRIDWGAIGSFFDGIFDGGGGGGSYTGSGSPVYNGYLPGYYIPNYYPPSYDPWVSYPNAGPSQPAYSSSVSYLMNYLSLNQEQLDFLVNHNDMALALENYFLANGTTDENIEFGNWAVGYLMRNPDFASLTNYLNRMSFLHKISSSQLTQAINLTNIQLRSIEEQFLIEDTFTDAEAHTIAELVIAQYAEDYFNNTSKFSSLLANPNDDDPFWNFIKSKLRKFMGIDQPETYEERYEQEQVNRNIRITGTNIERTQKNLSYFFSFLPGYSAFEAIALNNGYTAAAINTSFDLFGGALLKTIGSPILKLGKNTFSVFNLGLKYPNIVARLRSYSITEFNIIKRTNTEKVIIIGEKMEERVLPATNDVFKRIFKNAETFVAPDYAEIELRELKRNLGRNLTNAELKNTAMYLENQKWIRDKLAAGYNVIDIGPKIPKNINSIFYEMERSFIYTK